MTPYRRRHDVVTWHRRQQVVLSTLCSRWDNFVRVDIFFAVRPTASESICRCKGTYEGCDSASLVTCSEGILTCLTFFKKPIQGSSRFVIRSRIYIQTGILRAQYTRGLFAWKLIHKAHGLKGIIQFWIKTADKVWQTRLTEELKISQFLP